MTGDETNKNKMSCLVNHGDTPCPGYPDPVASNTGNTNVHLADVIVRTLRDSKTTYSNNYTAAQWLQQFLDERDKRIAELERELAATQKLVRDSTTDNYNHVVSLRFKLASLESSLEGMKKRNDALELRHGRYQMAIFELEFKLKAAEDKLAGCEKNTILRYKQTSDSCSE